MADNHRYSNGAAFTPPPSCFSSPSAQSASLSSSRSSRASAPAVVHDHAFLDCLLPHTDSAAAAPPPASHRFALIVVNGEVGEFLLPLWQHASIRLCADGGANRVYDALPAAVRDSVLPSALIGDFDSIRPAVLAAYRQRGVAVHHDADQDSTDLHKALQQLRSSCSSPLSLPPFVVVYAAFGGRFDQQVANLHTLRSHCGLFPCSRLLLLSEGNMLTALPAAVSRHWLLRPHPQYEGRGGHCGLFALGAAVKAVTTRGLKWDIAGWDVGWGGCMPTNNVIDADEIEVWMDGDEAQQEADAQLLWTTEFSRRGKETRETEEAESAAVHRDNGNNR